MVVGLPIMLTRMLYGTSAVITDRTRGMLATMLVLIIVLLTPEEMPLLAPGTEPMTELALGLRNRPMPNPTRIRPNAIGGYDVVAVNPERHKKLLAATTRPVVPRSRAPHLSESDPLMGPIKRRVALWGMMNMRALWGSE